MTKHVVSIKRKFDDAVRKRWEGTIVQETRDWLVVFYHGPAHETEGGEHVEFALGYFAIERPLVVLVSFDGQHTVLEYQCDAALPFRMVENEIHWVDLDVDVMSGPDLTPHIRDLDDFARNSRAMNYDAAAIAAAGDGINLALSLMLARQCPFDDAPSMLLAETVANGARR